MASKQNSKTKKTCKRIRASMNRSDWAAWMNGAPIEWLYTREALELAQVFEGPLPGWLIESEPWRQVTCTRFRFLREGLLGLTLEQCGAYLDVDTRTIRRWENGESPVPRAPFEALRLVAQTAAQRLSHREWAGWFIERSTGELISPDVGRLRVRPTEINSLPRLYSQISLLQGQLDVQARELAALHAENTALRSSVKSRQIAAELEAMQERIASLLSSVRTAEIIEFSTPATRRAS